MKFDSEASTRKHIAQVGKYLCEVINELTSRIIGHDASKLSEEEKDIFDKYTPRLATSTYGSDEYKTFLKEMKPALDHHYKVNKHHPECHWINCDSGLNKMNLIDIIEMLCDWKSATLRHDDGDIYKSIEMNQKRFGYSDELKDILLITASDLGY